MQSVRAIVEHVNVLPGITCQALLLESFVARKNCENKSQV